MFGFMRKGTELKIFSPVKGRQIALEEVADPVFAQKLVGNGAAFIWEEDTLYAPCGGEIILVANTKHALGLKAENGMEILIHIGMDTVNLNGEGFEVLVSRHEKVKAHQPLLRVDRQFMEEKEVDLTTPMVITDSGEYEITVNDNDTVDLDDIIIQARKRKKEKTHESYQKYQ